MKTIKLGDWYSYCCCLDAYEVETQEDINDLLEVLKDGNELGVCIYPTKKELWANLCSCEKPMECKLLDQSIKG